MSLQTWRWTELLQMLEVTTIDSQNHVAVKHLLKYATALSMCFVFFSKCFGYGFPSS